MFSRPNDILHRHTKHVISTRRNNISRLLFFSVRIIRRTQSSNVRI